MEGTFEEKAADARCLRCRDPLDGGTMMINYYIPKTGTRARGFLDGKCATAFYRFILEGDR